MKRDDWVCVYPAFCIRKDVYEGIFTPAFERANHIWPSYAIGVTIRDGHEEISYVGLPAKWYRKEIRDMDRLVRRLRRKQVLTRNVTVEFDDGMQLLANGHFANEPSGHQIENIYIEGDLEDERCGQECIEGLNFPVGARRTIRNGDELLWCYGHQYIRENYEEPEACVERSVVEISSDSESEQVIERHWFNN